MIEGRLDARLLDAIAIGIETLDKHVFPGVVAKEHDPCAPVDIGKPLTERDEGAFDIRGDAQGVR